MGITIHYSGRARNREALTNLLSTAQMFASARGWMFALYDDPLGDMEDLDHDDPGFVEYDGPYRGMVIRAHRKCEPIRLNFRVGHEMTPASTMTQFAPCRIHVDVVKLLHAIAPFMETLEVVDESGLYEGETEPAARRTFDLARGSSEMPADLVEDDPDADGIGFLSAPDDDDDDESDEEPDSQKPSPPGQPFG